MKQAIDVSKVVAGDIVPVSAAREWTGLAVVLGWVNGEDGFRRIKIYETTHRMTMFTSEGGLAAAHDRWLRSDDRWSPKETLTAEALDKLLTFHPEKWEWFPEHAHCLKREWPEFWGGWLDFVNEESAAKAQLRFRPIVEVARARLEDMRLKGSQPEGSKMDIKDEYQELLPADHLSREDVARIYPSWTPDRIDSETADGRLYRVKVASQEGNVLHWPAWQFHPSATRQAPTIFAMQRFDPKETIHAFWVTGADEFNELTPAEVLTGLAFSTRQETLLPSQVKLLNEDAARRQWRVATYLLNMQSFHHTPIA